MNNISFEKPKNVEYPYFVATLSDGRKVYENKIDNQPHAWRRLKSFVQSNSLQITSMSLVFKNNQVNYPDKKNSYFYGFKSIGVWPSGKKMNLVGGGYFDEKLDQMVISWFQHDGKPAFKENRDLNKCGFLAISNE